MGLLGQARGRRVHSGSRGFLRVVLFILFRVGSLGRIFRSSGSFVFAWGFTSARLVDVGFIRVLVCSLRR